MSLVVGTRLGPYEIQSAIGAGGMGEVYRARDTRLDRTVAIKVLPPDVSADPERRARFEREGKTIAGLNHAHICTLYDVGDHDGATFLVMEHIIGQTLAERLSKGPLPLEQALTIATEIAEALSAAHRQGVIHRDLKPANVMLTKAGAKLLDFGLAKLTGHGEVPAAVHMVSAAPTQAPLTGQGVIVGTLHYMAPEQLEGKPADGRTDLWALGAILYEMLTGKRAFEGTSAVSVMAGIMDQQPPPVATLQPLTPPTLDRLVRRCLSKSPDDRPDSAHDVADDLRWLRESSAGASRALGGRRLPGLAAVAVIFLVAGTLVGWWLQPSTRIAGIAVSIEPADELNGGDPRSPRSGFVRGGGRPPAFTWTPDGKALVFVGRRAGVQQLFVRPLATPAARPVPHTENARVPAVSKDGRWVAFWADGVIKKVPLAGGPVVDVARQGLPFGMIWDGDDALLYDDPGLPGDPRGIWKVTADGKRTPLTTVSEGEVIHMMPALLPGGRTLLYTVRRRLWSWSDPEVVATDLATGRRTTVLVDATHAQYVDSGHLVFLRRGTLFAVPFDPDRLLVRGAPVAVVEGIAQEVSAAGSVSLGGQFALSTTGAIAWASGDLVPNPPRVLVRVDRQGRVSPLPAPPGRYGAGVRLSPSGDELAVSTGSWDDVSVYTLQLGDGAFTRVTRVGEADGPIWSPDQRHVVFSWRKNGGTVIARQDLEAATPPEVLATVKGVIPYPSSWTAAGAELLFSAGPEGWMVATFENGRASVGPLPGSDASWMWPEFSPDGRWLVYGTRESGRYEVYVQPYRHGRRRVRISTEGGESPAWRKDGREIFFLSSRAGKPRMMVTSFDAASGQAGVPRPLFDLDPAIVFYWTPLRAYDVSPDGQHFYARQDPPVVPLPPVTHINLITDWLEQLKAKVPR